MCQSLKREEGGSVKLASAPPSQRRPNASGQLAGAERLGEGSRRRRRSAPLPCRSPRPGRQHHHAGRGSAPEAAQGVEAIDPREHVVEDDDVRLELAGLGQAGDAGSRDIDLEAFPCEVGA